MKRLCRTFEIDVHSQDEFEWYMAGADRIVCFPKETDVDKGDIFLINFNGRQTSCYVIRLSFSHRMNDSYRTIYLNSIYPE